MVAFRQHTQAAALVILMAVLGGCTTARTYRRLTNEFETGQQTDYYRHEAAEALASASQTSPVGESVDETQRQLMAMKARWETALTTASASIEAESNSEGPGVDYSALAASPDLSRHLADGLELKTLLGVLPHRNPAVKAAGASVRAALEEYPQAVHLDTILKQYNAFTKQLNTTVGPQNHKGMVAMSFPFPDALALKGRIASEDVELAERGRQIALRDAAASMRRIYHAYAFATDALAINRESQALLEQMITVAQAKIRSGKAKYNAVIMAQVELSKLADGIITLENERQTLAARMNTLIDRVPDAPLGPPKPVADTQLVPELDELYELAVSGRQEVQQKRIMITRMETMVELATRMAQPDPVSGANYLEDRMRLTGRTAQGGDAFPTKRDLDHRETAWFGQRDAYVRQMRAQVESAKLALQELENNTRMGVKEIHFNLDKAERKIALYRSSLLPQARQAFESAATAYRAGNADFLMFLDSQRTLLRFRLAEKDAVRARRIQLSDLERLVGHSLTYRLIETEPAAH